MTESPAAPAGIVAGSWHEAYADIAAAALEQRRLAGDDMDADRVAGKVPAACAEIDQYLELRPVLGRVQYVVGGVPVVAYAPGDEPAPVREAAVQLTLELYDRKDARFGVLTGASSTFGEPVRVSPAPRARGAARAVARGLGDRVTDPLPELPANAVDDARTLLHTELVATLAAVGWSTDGRVFRHPPITPPTPGAWVDVPTLSAQGAGLVLTFPLGVAVDGNERSQVERLDALLAILWTRLEAVKIPDGLRLAAGSTLQVMTAGPEPLEIGGGPTVRTVALTVQVPVSPRTLCPTALTAPITGDTPS